LYPEVLLGAAAGGCDSLIELELAVNAPSSRNINLTICNGEYIQIGQETFNQQGRYTVILKGGNAAGCDSTVNLNLEVLNPSLTQFSRTICAGEFYEFFGRNFNLTASYEEILKGKAANGCDSIVNLDLNVLPAGTRNLNVEICAEDSYTLNSETFLNSGTYTQILPKKAASGCDSVIILNLRKLSASNSTLSKTICFGQTYAINGETFSKSGTYKRSFTNSRGCDSTFVLELTVLESSTAEISAHICEGETYLFGSNVLDTAGKYTLTRPGVAASGCDSVINLTLTYGTPSSAQSSVTICHGDSIKIGTYTLSASGDYTLKLPRANAQKCDSIIQLRVNKLPEAANLLKASICRGETYRFFGQSFDAPGTYSRRLFGAAKSGCDSILYLELKVFEPVVHQINKDICQGSRFDFFGQSLSQSGDYRKIFPNGAANGCDSIVELRLRVLPPSQDTFSVSLCRGETFSLQNKTFSSAGTFQVLLPGATASGCDSIVLVKVTILPDARQKLSVSICRGDTFTLAGQKFSASGIFQDTLPFPAANGCDSLVELTLGFYPEARQSLEMPLCLGKTLQINGQTLDTAGIYQQVIKGSSRFGCDSTLMIKVFETKIDTPKFAVTLCADTAFSFAGKRFENAGEFLVKVPTNNKNGCDSLVALSLSKKSPDKILSSLNICKGDSLIFGSLNLKVSGNYNQVFKNSAGCDSVVTLSLEVLDEARETLDTLICLGEKYKNWGKIFSQAGNYQIPLESMLGCDSLVNLNLTVEPADTFFIKQNLCIGKTYSLNGQEFFNSGKYLQVLPKVTPNGCDSLILVDLSFSDAIEATLEVEICPGESFISNGVSYFKEGTFTQFFPKGSTSGCDSLLQIRVSILPEPNASLQKNLCQGDTLQLHGGKFTRAGSYTLELPNSASNGCDSLILLEVKELQTGKGRLGLTLCAGDTLNFSGRLFPKPGIFPIIFDNASTNGCDSVLQLEIIGLSNGERTLSERICEGTSYKLDTAVYEQAGNYRYIFPNRALNGCDSIIDLQLAYIPTPKKIIADTLCFGESRMFFGRSAAKTGSYNALVPSPAGCDSLIILNLYILRERMPCTYWTQKMAVLPEIL